MANGHTIIPVNDSILAQDSIEYLKNEMVFIPEHLPEGRFPTLAELRQAILALGFKLEETHDWYVTSEDDHTEIWFSEPVDSEDEPISLWFRRGDLIILDILQNLAGQCGSFIVIDHSGAGVILIVPDSVFGMADSSSSRYLDVLSRRIPVMFRQLTDTSLESILFRLSQIHQALRKLDYLRHHPVFQIARDGVPLYAKLMQHQDVRVRSLAFELVVLYREHFFEYAGPMGQTIIAEKDPNAKARMIWELEKQLNLPPASGNVAPWTQALLDILLVLAHDTAEPAMVRFAAANIRVRSQPGFVTEPVRALFVDALIHPEQYVAAQEMTHGVSQETLRSIRKFMLHQRISMLLEALPRIAFAQDAHDVLHALLDDVFFGDVRISWMSTMPDSQEAERPPVDDSRFRAYLMRSWLYPASPIKLAAAELMPFQREILTTVMALDIPWMVHSNLLEKYGLPVTRAAVKAWMG